MSDTFANPQPPSNYTIPHSKEEKLTNDDFRKLLMTPGVSSVREKAPLSTRVDMTSNVKKKVNDEARKERKLYYASLMKEAKEREKELALKYRDRAKERRETDKNPSDPDYVSTTSNFRAVAPGFSLTDNAERRRQIIEESKYLGGDLEHTHLVKGLDYALLQKIKAESEKPEMDHDDEEEKPQMDQSNQMEHKEQVSKSEEVEEDESTSRPNLKPKILSKTATAALAAALNKSLTDAPFAFKKQLENVKAHKSAKGKASIDKNKLENEDNDDDENRITFKTKLGRNIYRVLFEAEQPKRNELFLPHRMAYIVELNEEETDVPITSIRSKADCPSNENNATLTTNDIVINKLTQILSYLRHGKRDAKKLKKKTNIKVEESETQKVNPNAGLSIYDEIGDYVPDLSKKDQSKDTKKESVKEEDKSKKTRDYFGMESSLSKKEFSDSGAISKEAATAFIKSVSEKYAAKELVAKKEEKKSGMSIKFDPDSYAECYPGTKAEEDVNIDSDEEADFSKMDLGNKKGPVNRWDFDTNEEYNDYMSNREALPKAAFQYGQKMTDGRKSRRMPTDNKNDKAKLDKEWTQISKIIDKRKSGDNNSQYKKPKY